MDFKGEGRRLQSIDITRIAATIGCGEDHLHAVMEVETRGGGFDRHGRIKMLFEPHVFYRQLGPGPKREQAISAGLAYRSWGEQRYPNDSYPRLQAAMNIDQIAALRSCSWGLGQVMGFNHGLAGYASAEAMVADFLDSEAKHLQAMVAFIVNSGLDDDLRREDWAGFARGYNGSGYRKHGYHTKLARAYAKWRAIPDTPATSPIDREEVDPNPPEVPTIEDGRPVLRLGDKGASVRILQADLAAAGYFSGKQDGDFGPITRAAVLAFQADHELETDGVVGGHTWAALASPTPRPERDVDEEDLRDSGTLADMDILDRVADLGGVAGIVAIGSSASDALDQTSGILERLTNIAVSYWPALIAIAVGFVVIRGVTKKTRNRRVADAKTGRHLGR